MKWLLPAIWLLSILYIHLRGKVRLPVARQFLDHSVFFAPINALLILNSRVPRTPYLDPAEIPELAQLRDNWKAIRDEALHLSELRHIKASAKHDDIGFNSFFKYGWKRFYLKWYDVSHPSARVLCPRTVALLQEVPSVKAAIFAELPPGSQLNPHRDPFAGSLRYHLGLSTPNSDHCCITVDGQTYSWRDGRDVLFDETYVHEVHNASETTRFILFCDVERPVKTRWVERLNHWFGRVIMSAASSPNQQTDETGAINRLTHLHWKFDQQRKRFKAWNRSAYKAAKYALIALAVVGFIVL